MPCLFSPLYPSCDSINEICEQHGIKSWCLEETFRPSQASKGLHDPLSFLTPNLKISGRQWLIEAPATANASLQSGLIRLGCKQLYETNKTNVNSQVRFWKRSGSLPPGWWHRPRAPQRNQKSLIYLSTHNNPNYFHWLTQPGLSPIFLQDHFCLSSLPQVALALSHRPRLAPPSFVHPLLEVFAPSLPVVQGVSLTSDSLCRFALHEQCSDVVISPSQLRWLNQRSLNQLQISRRPWRRVLISRQGSRRRRCLNEDALFSALAPYGFELHILDDLSVIQQLRLFSESILIVGPHGAGFSNLVACSPMATIIELFPRPGSFSHYYAMADVLGLRHGHLLASSFELANDDFAISPSDLLMLIREMELV